MDKFFKYLFYGLFIGMIVAVALYALGFVVELGNIACAILTCDCDRGDALPFMWSWDSFKTCFLWTTIGGTIIGGIYGATVGIQERNDRLAKWKRDNDERALAERQGNATNLKKMLNERISSSRNTKKIVDEFKINTTFVSSSVQKKSWKMLKEARDINSELQGILEELDDKEVQ